MKMENVNVPADPRGRRVFHSQLLPWIVLLVGIPTAIFLFMLMQSSVENLARLRFEREANDANGIIEGRLRSYADVLYAMRALFATEESLSRLRFQRFVES